MIAEPPLDGGQSDGPHGTCFAARAKKQEGEIRKRRHEAGAGDPLKEGELA
jgi:hypothetical protein